MALEYPHQLPISEKREEIIELLHANQVIIIAGDTGSGKTTQLPKMCLEMLLHSSARIGCTQPRRIAAMTVSSRVTEELGDLGHLVGYKIRFQDKTNQSTRIKFMTDGVLLAETRNDHLLRQYDVLIIDEAHERSLNIDFLLGYLKNILPRRRDLKIIITSATIDTASFARHFNNAPIVAISGKTYPIETRYQPPDNDEYGEPENYIELCAIATQDIVMKEPPGDILIFLPTEKDILNCSKLLKKKIDNVEVLPLFGRLHSADQKKIFQQCNKTKIVVATNVAETSITVPGIRYVIDTGLARISYYNFRAKTNSLPIRKISQASCEQRKGRCGRIGPGVCIRLYHEEDFVEREPYSVPEIKRSNLAEVILQMLFYKLGDPANFPFLDPPHSSAINDGYKLLSELGAIDSQRKLTRVGKIMASLPIDPCIARIIIEANSNNCLREIMVIAAVLAIQDPRVRPVGHENKADKVHEVFKDKHSDFNSFLKIWDSYHAVCAKTSWSRLKKFCKTHFLSFQRMREWIDLHDQMSKIIHKQHKFKINDNEALYDAIHKSLACGFLRNIAVKKEKKLYQGPANKELMIFPGSNIFSSPPQWIIAASFLETNRLYALTAAVIEPEWLEPLAGDLIRYSWFDPQYNIKSGQVMANERVSLFGLTLVPSRKVNFGKTNKKNLAEARGIFIQSALVESKLRGNYKFLKKNRALINKWEKVENRLRSRNVVVSEEVIYKFYDSRLPEWVFDKPSLIKFLKRTQNSQQLCFTEEEILLRKPDGQELADFPPALKIGSHSFRLDYSFDPSGKTDGITVNIPFELFNTINPEILEWVVPGFIKEKITFLLKSLPKKIRKHLVPINIAVDTILDDIVMYKGSLYHAIESSILKQFRISIKRSEWIDKLPDHLIMRISLFDINGKEVASGRDARTIGDVKGPDQKLSSESACSSDQEFINSCKNILITDFNINILPIHIPLYTVHKEIAGYLYPALSLRPEKSGVVISFLSNKEEARRKSIAGIRYLIKLSYSKQFKSFKKQCTTNLSGPSSLWLIRSFTTKAEATTALLDYIIDSIFTPSYEILSDGKKMQNFKNTVTRTNFIIKGTEALDQVMSLLRLRNDVTAEISRHKELSRKTRSYSASRYEEYLQLLDEILPNNFLTAPACFTIEDMERYMRGLIRRIDRAHADFLKDEKKDEIVRPFYQRMQETELKDNITDECQEKLHHYKVLLQEYRLSVFSPEIKTKIPISAKRLNTAWQDILHHC